jgi:hypothetical protein
MRVRDEQSALVGKLVSLGRGISRHKSMVAGVVAAVIIIAAFGSRNLFVDSSWMSDFRDDSELAVATDLLNERFAGTITLNVIVDGKQDNALKSPQLLKAIDDLQNHVEQLPEVGNSLSLADFLKNMNMNLNAGDKAFDVLPDNRALISEYLFLFSISGRPEELDEVVDFNYRQANVSFMIKSDHTQVLRKVIDEVKAYSAQRFADLDVDINLAGSGNNSYIWADLLIDSQTLAIVVSKLGILILASLLLRSLLLGLLVVVPVTLTTLIMAGIAGYFAIPLDVSTALAAGVAIGVGVDYAVHLIFRYRRAYHATEDHQQALAASLRGVGKTILFNAAVVTAGFAVLFFSVFPPHVKLGYFVSGYMVLSCLVALTVLPVLFAWLHPHLKTQRAD